MPLSLSLSLSAQQNSFLLPIKSLLTRQVKTTSLIFATPCFLFLPVLFLILYPFLYVRVRSLCASSTFQSHHGCFSLLWDTPVEWPTILPGKANIGGQRGRIMDDCSRVLRILFGALVFVGLIWFSYVGVIANQATNLTRVTTISSTGNLEHMKLIGRERHDVHQDWDLNYVSKRRVPNGPDPIHNRREGKSRQPPGRA